MRAGRTWHDRHLGYLFVLPATLMLVAVLVFPAFITLKLSLTPDGGSGWALTLTQYRKALGDSVLLYALVQGPLWEEVRQRNRTP